MSKEGDSSTNGADKPPPLLKNLFSQVFEPALSLALVSRCSSSSTLLLDVLQTRYHLTEAFDTVFVCCFIILKSSVFQIIRIQYLRVTANGIHSLPTGRLLHGSRRMRSSVRSSPVPEGPRPRMHINFWVASSF